MTVQIHNPHIKKLLILSEQDASVLDFPLPDPIFGFHAQQSFEKLLKAFLSAHSVQYPFTHDLDALVRLLAAQGEQLPVLPFDMLRLQRFAVELRYDLGPTFDEKEKAAIREAIAQCSSYVIARIIACENPSPAP